MQTQHKVILSLGSNQGNRLENLEYCIDLLHQEVGTIIQISNVYESPAWGFESDFFYNCTVLLHTFSSPVKVLHQVLAIEKQLGRIRHNHGYQARTIDVDIIAFDEVILTTNNLTLPHPLLQDRNFVLLPLRELVPQWSHPVSKKPINDLINNTIDTSVCKVVATIKVPLINVFAVANYKYIAFEGNIGAGKTALTTRIAEDFNAKMTLERFANNPFLPKFYEDQDRYAFSLEMSFLADRYRQLTDDWAQFDFLKDFVVADYHIFKSLIFAKITLSEDEYRLYYNLFTIIYREIPKPDLYIYLYQNSTRLLENIKNRGRDYEQNISEAYLDKINEGYLEYIKSQHDLNVLIIDISGLDFVKNQYDYLYILQQINNTIKK